MNSHNFKKILVLVFVAIILLSIYLNRAYSHIYGVLGAANLKPVEVGETYLINNMNGTATTTLVYAALGDSLTAGVGTDKYSEMLPYLLAEKLTGYDKQVLLNNYSVPGAGTADVVTDYLPLAIKDNPDVVTLLIGVNDIHNKVSAKEFAKNYETILSRLKKETKAVVYVINIPFIGSEELMLPPYQSIFDLRTREFNGIITDLADKYAVQYIDLYAPTVDLFKRDGDHYSKDLFHPSVTGYKLWADIIYDHINQ
ncbi:MAG: SGNH/GDSL hydrolase family protein [Patescibacteria group bacterium]